MRDYRCRECGYLYDTVRGKPDPYHPCTAYRTDWPHDPRPTDTSFIKPAWNTRDGLERYRKALR